MVARMKQPLDEIRWVNRELLHANDYNPNRVAPPELALLKTSILEDGWTQPIVVRYVSPTLGYEIVDGFHRWMVSADKQIAALTGGKVPIVVITPDAASQRMSTIRHNRARGTHHVVRMADIVADLVEHGLTREEVGRRLSMEVEEVDRLVTRGRHEVADDAEFSGAWRPARR